MEYVPIWARDFQREANQKKTEEIAERMIKKGLRIETIAEYLDITVEEAKKLTEKFIN
ncbi:MAG: hypothetical protein ACM3SY_06690 [Candidatus Omnitrophota bacterium]